MLFFSETKTSKRNQKKKNANRCEIISIQNKHALSSCINYRCEQHILMGKFVCAIGFSFVLF